MKHIIGIFGASLLLFSSCQKKSCSDGVKAEFQDATGIGGCGFVLQLKNGDYLEPKNLSDLEFTPRDGDKIWVSYHLVQTGGTNCMMGDVVIIDCISKR